jgi:hypothetical protein
MNVNFVFWHEMFSSLGPKVPLVKREKSWHIAWLTNGEIVFAPTTFSPPMIVSVLALDGFYFFVGSLAQKTNMFVKH